MSISSGVERNRVINLACRWSDCYLFCGRHSDILIVLSYDQPVFIIVVVLNWYLHCKCNLFYFSLKQLLNYFLSICKSEKNLLLKPLLKIPVVFLQIGKLWKFLYHTITSIVIVSIKSDDSQFPQITSNNITPNKAS